MYMRLGSVQVKSSGRLGFSLNFEGGEETKATAADIFSINIEDKIWRYLELRPKSYKGSHALDT